MSRKAIDKTQYLRKLIDIPKPMLNDLKKLAIDADKSLKSYIEDLLISEVEKNRQPNQENG